ncbi:hypothetical protein BSR28_06085 [Boudabousia liubingyangii]|uniref:DUF7768 domain-containing protein n=1 Tax=Boudabousia liubingyangii TaxID=1921764 RepID=UPI00093FE05D|nr:DUF4406 domain-containing protein [Boudabousia liubingyangii]OKL46986.1 hypothetical protein BSR28_06085 [Boudabousia liubingyangii]
MADKTYSWFEPDLEHLINTATGRRLIYVSSAYSGDTKRNTHLAKAYARFVHDCGYVPIVPHLLFPQFLDEETEREAGIEAALSLLELCDEYWAFGNLTEGMVTEFKASLAMGIPNVPFTVTHLTEDGTEYLGITPSRKCDQERFTALTCERKARRALRQANAAFKGGEAK